MDEGISVLVSGPRQNLLELFTVVVNSVFREISPDGDDERDFPEAFKEQLQVYFNDTLDIQSLSEGLLSHLLVDRFTNLFQLYDDLNRFTFDDYSNFLRSYKRKMFVEVELNGSASQADYDGILGVINGLGYSTCLLMNSYADRGTVIPHGASVIYLQAGHTAFVTSLVTAHFQLCASSDVEEARFAKILFHAMRRKLPQQLRTVEQIGYTARLNLWDEFGSVGFTIMVYTQPTKFNTEHVDSRITTFIRSFYDKYLKTGEIFQKLVAPYVKEKVDFFRCKQFYAGTLLEKGSKCRKLSIHIRGFPPGSQAKSSEDTEGGGDAKPLLQYQTIGKQKLEELEKKGIQIIDNLDRFKRNLSLRPAAN
ncbi:Nardilysin [Orchesella cincta]|uniref:Nardilysin n=1 Tax=Orchesella cincta TaxID=48709 RepID=A0A1D2MDN9_ORCCI|nr:Nardilysin [Orchesella cincta]